MKLPPTIKVWTRAQLVRLHKGDSWEEIEAMSKP